MATLNSDSWARYRDIRLAALADAPAMFGSTHALEHDQTPDQWRARILRAGVLIASHAGRDVGLATVRPLTGDDADPFGTGTWILQSGWVAPAARGSGVIDALLDAAERYAHRHGATAVALWVYEDNAAGIGAYRRAGYLPTDHTKLGHGQRLERAMTKTLPSCHQPAPPASPTSQSHQPARHSLGTS